MDPINEKETIKKDTIREHYRQEALRYKDSQQSTMLDLNTREKELEVLREQLKIIKRDHHNNELGQGRSNDCSGDYRVLEVGCGNGYVAEKLSQELALNIEGIDFCPDFIEIARQRKSSGVSFSVGDVLDLPYPDETFEAIFTERCLINLETVENQHKAVENIWRKLKRGGKYIMIESFTDGLENLNQARAIVGLEPIPPPAHNKFFDKNDFLSFIQDKFEMETNQNFMSSYFFGSRVLYPALAPGPVVYNNKFIEFFRYLPAYGNYGHLQLHVLKKKDSKDKEIGKKIKEEIKEKAEEKAEENGGKKAEEKINLPLFRIRWQEEDLEAVNTVIRRGAAWAAGPEIGQFEQALASFQGRAYALTFNSGTSALLAMYQAVGVEGKEVIVPSFTFIATANAIILAGGVPVFAESEAETLGLEAEDVEKRITPNTKAIVALHYAGGVCRDIEKLQQMAKKHQVLLLEDNAHSLGVRKKGRLCGTFGIAAALSFCQNKLITTGEGGAVITDSPELYEKMKLLRSHGRVDPVTGDYFSSATESEYILPGHNLRMPTMNAALGLSQLRHFEETIRHRVRQAQDLSDGLKAIPQLKLPQPYWNSDHFYQMFTVMLPSRGIRDSLQAHLTRRGIMSKVYYPPIHLSTFYRRKFGYKVGDLPRTEQITRRILTLPIHPTMNEKEKTYLIAAIKGFFETGGTLP